MLILVFVLHLTWIPSPAAFSAALLRNELLSLGRWSANFHTLDSFNCYEKSGKTTPILSAAQQQSFYSWSGIITFEHVGSVKPVINQINSMFSVSKQL